jgi:hypothetical protein
MRVFSAGFSIASRRKIAVYALLFLSLGTARAMPAAMAAEKSRWQAEWEPNGCRRPSSAGALSHRVFLCPRNGAELTLLHCSEPTSGSSTVLATIRYVDGRTG